MLDPTDEHAHARRRHLVAGVRHDLQSNELASPDVLASYMANLVRRQASREESAWLASECHQWLQERLDHLTLLDPTSTRIPALREARSLFHELLTAPAAVRSIRREDTRNHRR